MEGHGIKIKGAGQIWLAVIGPDTKALGELDNAAQYYQSQVAGTLAAYLGLNFQSNQKVDKPIPLAIDPNGK